MAEGSTTSTWPASIFRPSAQFDRAHRNHPRQQRRGAIRRQCGRRRHQYRAEERRRRPTGCHPRRSRRRLLQSTNGIGLGHDQLRTVVDVILRQRHQVRRLSRKQRARPAQRGRQSQLHHARPQGLLDRDRRRPEARLARRPASSVPRRASTSSSPTAAAPATPFDYGNQQGASATAGFTKTICERRRSHRRWRCAGQEAAGRLLQSLRTTVTSTRQPSADMVPDAPIEHQERDVRAALVDPDRHRLLRRDVPPGAAGIKGTPPIHTYDLSQRTLAGYWQQTIGLLPTTDFSYGARIQNTTPERQRSS